ncbi:MAG: rhomboid family intramembrane serine protease [Bacillaceae bacterium]
MERIFWGVIHFLIIEKEWNMIYASEELDEVWLEKDAQVVRLYEKTFDWANHVRQDLIRVYSVSEQLAKQKRKEQITVHNFYFCEQLPVDDWEYVTAEMNRTHGSPLFQVVSRMEKNDSIIEIIMDVKEELQLTLEETKKLTETCERASDNIKYEVMNYLRKEEKQKEKVFHYGKPRFTQILIGIQVLVFILMTLKGGSTNPYVLIQFGAKFDPLIDQGEWWRLITSIFLHIGFLHLLMNTFALYYIGTQLERLIGNIRFIVIYLLAGVVGSYSSYIFNDGIGAGASGAIFGCFGALFVVSILYKKFIPKEVIKNIVVLIGINLLFGFLVPSIDNAAHIGGLLTGILLMFIIGVPMKKS